MLGDLGKAESEEEAALVFAIHFAETAGNPHLELWRQLEAIHGVETAHDILIHIRMITLGNLTGNTVDALLSRFQGRPAPDSTLVDELLTLGLIALGLIPFSIAFATRIALADLPQAHRPNTLILQE